MARVAKSFVEPLKSRGESGLIGFLLVSVAVFARVAHASTLAAFDRGTPAPLKPRGPY